MDAPEFTPKEEQLMKRVAMGLAYHYLIGYNQHLSPLQRADAYLKAPEWAEINWEMFHSEAFEIVFPKESNANADISRRTVENK